MPAQPTKPYWIDVLGRKHEGYPFGDADARTVTVEHEGRTLRLLMPEYTPLTAVRATATSGDLLFLLGEQLDEEDEDDIIEGGDGIAMVARRQTGSDDTYSLFVCHVLFPQTLQSSGCRES
jgi:hypothetical protein